MVAHRRTFNRVLPSRRESLAAHVVSVDAQSFGAPYVLLLSIASANAAGATKKAITAGAIFIGYNAGNISAA